MRLAAALLVAAVTLPAAGLRSWVRNGNRVRLALSHGSARIEWVSPSSFRWERVWSGELRERAPVARESVKFAVRERGEALEFETNDVFLTLSKKGLLASVETVNRETLMRDLTEAERRGGRIAWYRVSRPGARYFGLGPRPEPELDLRGAVRQAVPFLVSTAGYGESHFAQGGYTFTFEPERYRIEIEGAELDYAFHYGPSPTAIYEERLKITGLPDLNPPPPAKLPKTAPATWDSLAAAVRRMAQESLSGMLAQHFTLWPYRKGAPELFRRAAQAAAVSPWVEGQLSAEAQAIRDRFRFYMQAYTGEVSGRGLPMLRALPFEFPQDAEAARYSDQWIFGDDLLVAPVLSPEPERRVYLPAGNWTRLRSNQRYPGRQTIAIQAAPDELPLFARNGSILPLEDSGVVALHYFPQLAGQCFLYESDLGDYSQFHAAPAGEYLRLQIESLQARDYEWVVHNVGPAREGMRGATRLREARPAARLAPGSWRYDRERRNLHARVRVRGGEDCILNFSF